jgi:hypothetical protein
MCRHPRHADDSRGAAHHLMLFGQFAIQGLLRANQSTCVGQSI